MRRLGAIGTFVWDRIDHPAAPEPVEQWGGAAYSLAALSAAAPDGWWIAPIVKVGADLADDATRFLSTLSRIDPRSPLRVVPQPNNRVELRYLDAAHRRERLTGGVPPWRWPELEAALAEVDALYVNFLSGFEMDLPTARLLRRSFAGPIYADLHSLFLGPPGAGPRAPRPLAGWKAWLGCFNVVQMNETELALLADGALVEHPERILDQGPSAVVVTLGEAGARVIEASGSIDVPQPVAIAGDPTGCGDVWGATTFCRWLGGATLREAAEAANRAAAAKVREPRTERLAGVLGALR